MNAPEAATMNEGWKTFYRISGAAALAVVLTGVSEIGITFLPGGSASAETAAEWFGLFAAYPFMGLRNLGLLNIIMTLLGVPVTVALYAAHRRVNKPFAMLAMIISFFGAAVFFATNRAFPMLDLSRQYAAATEAERAGLLAAAQAMLAVGQSHTAGTYLAFLLSELGGLSMSLVMLRGGVFGKAAAWAGIVGYAAFLIFEFNASFLTGLSGATMALAIVGGVLSLVWHALVARRLLQLQ